MDSQYIQSRHNDQIKNLVKLRERKHRDRQELFLIEGLRELSHALKSSYPIVRLYYCPEYFPAEQHASLIRDVRDREDIETIRIGEEAFSKATYREGPDGIIAVARQQAHSIKDIQPGTKPLLLVLEGIEKPGNLGAILRSADGAGVDAVILVDCVLDLYNPNAIRASQGLLFKMPTICVERTYLMQWLSDKKIQCVATTPDAPKVYWEVDYSLPTAFLLGSESDGLSTYWLNQADTCVQIPMSGNADSLNVAASAAICLYEAKRQRSFPGL